MAMTKVLLVCIATCILCSLFLKPTSADDKHINYGAIGKDTGSCKGGKCTETPANTLHKPCTKEERCRDNPQSRQLTEEQVDSEDKEQVLQVENVASDSDSDEPKEEFIDRDIVVLGH